MREQSRRRKCLNPVEDHPNLRRRADRKSSKCVHDGEAIRPCLRPHYPSCMICLRPSSSADFSSIVTTPSRLRRRSLATARIWSLTATAGCPSQEIGIRIGGLAFGELDGGITITVLRLSFSTLAEITTQGRVLRISEPSVGSSATHQTSPRSRITSMVLPLKRRSRQIPSRFRPHPTPDWQCRRRGSTSARSSSRAARASLTKRERSREATLRRSCNASGSGTEGHLPHCATFIRSGVSSGGTSEIPGSQVRIRAGLLGKAPWKSDFSARSAVPGLCVILEGSRQSTCPGWP